MSICRLMGITHQESNVQRLFEVQQLADCLLGHYGGHPAHPHTRTPLPATRRTHRKAFQPVGRLKLAHKTARKSNTLCDPHSRFSVRCE
jgi:hypothetical protein